MKLSHVSAVCSSVENAKKFYQDILELSEAKQYAITANLSEEIFGISLPCEVVLYGNDDFSIEVFIPTRFERHASFVHTCLEVEQKEAFLERCNNAGVVVKRIPKGDKVLSFVEDFDGNSFEIKEVQG